MKICFHAISTLVGIPTGFQPELTSVTDTQNLSLKCDRITLNICASYETAHVPPHHEVRVGKDRENETPVLSSRDSVKTGQTHTPALTQQCYITNLFPHPYKDREILSRLDPKERYFQIINSFSSVNSLCL